MSYYTFFGAVVIPADTADPFTYFDEAAPRFQSRSRSGHFHSTFRSLLDVIPKHESLRFLSAQTATKEDHSSDGITSFTLLEQADLAVAANELDDLLNSIPDHIDALPEHVLSYWGGSSRIHEAFEEAHPLQEVIQEVSREEDGDSAEFFFAALRALQAIFRTGLDGTSKLLAHNWLPK